MNTQWLRVRFGNWATEITWCGVGTERTPWPSWERFGCRPRSGIWAMSDQFPGEWSIRLHFPFHCISVHGTCQVTQRFLYALLPAKPVHNLALRIFQRYYDDLFQVLSSSPEEVASILYSNDLLSRQEKNEVVDTLGLSPFRKAQLLLQAVEGKIVTENSEATLRKFCHVLRRHHGVRSVVARMRFRLGD